MVTNRSQVAVALAPTGAREDYSSRLFTPSFKETLLDVVGRLELGKGQRTLSEATVNRDGYSLSRGTVRLESWAWRLYAVWNGTVAVELATSLSSEARRPPSLDVIVAQAWGAAAEPLAELTGIPDREHVTTHFALEMTNGFHLHVRGVPGAVAVPGTTRPIQRWTTMATPSKDELESVTRELTRSARIESFESMDKADGDEA